MDKGIEALIADIRLKHGTGDVYAPILRWDEFEMLAAAINQPHHHNGMMQLSNELAEMKLIGKWVARSAHMPDPNDKRRVCVYTPNIADDIRYRLVPASLFKAVCSDATHWHYIEPPV